MIEVAFSNSFKRAYKKKIKGHSELENLFKNKLSIFLNNPFDNRLRTHKLSGKLSEIWSFSVTFSIRVTFIFVDEKKVLLESIGTHEDVY